MEEMNFETLLEESLKTLHTGEVVTGIVTAIDGEKAIYLDLGAKVTGTIEKEKIVDSMEVKLADLYKIGDEIRAFVIRVDDNNGVATLDAKRVLADANWVTLSELKDSREVIEAVVTEVVKGGIRLSYKGCKIFVPASQTDTPKNADLNALVGTTQRLVITKIEEERKSAVGSIREIAAAERKAAREEARANALANLHVGDHVTGTVKSMTTYGAFVDLGGIDGMVHNSELSWKRIKNPSEVVSVGQQIEVTIKDIDVDAQRISLAYKSEENDPWFLYKQAHTVGEVVEVPVTSLLGFGAFVDCGDGVEGLIPVGKISLDKINQPSDVLTVGQIVTARIVEFNDEKRRPTLSIKSLLLDEKRAADAEAAKERAEEARVRAEERKAAAEEAAKERAEMEKYIVASI